MNGHTHFLKLLDFTPAEIQEFLDTAADLKAKKKAGVPLTRSSTRAVSLRNTAASAGR